MRQLFEIRIALASALCAIALLGAGTSTAQVPNVANAERPVALPLQAWGGETLRMISSEMMLPQRGLYTEKATTEGGRMEPSFMWGAGVQFSALAAAARLEPDRYTTPLRAYADALQVYWTEHNGIGGYDVLPAPKPSDRYYDDNVWVVLALAETFEVTHDTKYRDRAEAAFRFVMSGEDDKLGGGLYWKENELASKNTCSNAPAIVAALRLYQLTRKPEYLATAHRLYDWTRATLQDPQDALFWDNIKLNGQVDRTKYSYNTALMIRANALFHAVTAEPAYLTEAQRIAHSAEAKWVNAETGGIADAGRFAHMLLESFLAVDQEHADPRWPRIVGNALAFVHEEVRDENGHYANRWDRPQTTALREFTLLDQASAARGYWVAAAELRD